VNGIRARSYDYDANGNRLTKTEGAATTTCTYDAQDRLQACGTTSFDAAGDLVSKTDASLPPGQQTTTYAYDAVGNLTRVDLPDGRAIEYVIDGQNRRVGKRVNGVLVQGWLYQDQLEPVAELDGAGNVVARFVYSDEVSAPDYLIRGGSTYRVLPDHLGSPRLVVDASSGTVVQRLDYDEWGVVTINTNPGFQPFGFAGGLYDPDTGFVRLGARDYDAGAARWTSKDPVRFESGEPNLYGYVLDDPVNFADDEGDARQHRKGKRRSTRDQNQKGTKRKLLDRGGEKAHPKRGPPRVRPKGWKGPWPLFYWPLYLPLPREAYCKAFPWDPVCTEPPPPIANCPNDESPGGV
jgi:RHS repeat-associated protein